MDHNLFENVLKVTSQLEEAILANQTYVFDVAKKYNLIGSNTLKCNILDGFLKEIDILQVCVENYCSIPISESFYNQMKNRMDYADPILHRYGADSELYKAIDNALVVLRQIVADDNTDDLWMAYKRLHHFFTLDRDCPLTDMFVADSYCAVTDAYESLKNWEKSHVDCN